VEQLHAVEHHVQRRFMTGIILKGNSSIFRVFPIPSYTGVEIRILEDPRCLSEVETYSFFNLTDTSESTLANLQYICQSIEGATSAQQWQEMATQAKELGIFTQPDKIKSNGENRDNFYFPAMVTFKLSPSSESIRKTIKYKGNTFYLFDHQVIEREGWCFDCRRVHGPNSPCEDDGALFQHICRGGQSWAVLRDKVCRKSLVSILIFIKTGQYQFERLAQAGRNDASIDSIFARMVWLQHYQSQAPVEGVVIVDDFLGRDDRCVLDQQVTALASDPRRTKHIVDPFFYTDDNRSFRQIEVEPCRIPNVELHPEDKEANICHFNRANFWGRYYHSKLDQYSVLPSYVSVSPNGDCSFDTYIPHLGWSPNDSAHLELYRSLSLLLKKALPYIESVYSYSYAMSRLVNIRRDKKPAPSPLQPLNVQPISLRGQKLQVITHIVEDAVKGNWNVLESNLRNGWHLEGRNCEEIVLTCLYILDNDDALQVGELEFQRMIASDEKPFVDRWIELAPLGKVAACSGRLIVYPNCHIKRSASLPQGTVGGKRRVVMFHLVNPLRRIRSTKEDAPWKQENHKLDKSHRRVAEESRKQSADCWGSWYADRSIEPPVRQITRSETHYKDDGKFWYY
jgi:hypothetical protein